MDNVVENLVEYMNRTGSTWCKYSDLEKDGVSIRGLDKAIADGKIIYSDYSGEDMFTIPEWHAKENSLAYNICRVRDANEKPLERSLVNEMIDKVEKENGYPYADEQRNAIFQIVINQLCVVTGGPGTGKTTTLTGALRALRFVGCKNIVFSAPTGKAARRMTESTKKPASTLHSVLKVNADNMDSPKEVNCDAIVIDEISMLDLDLANALFKAIPTGTRVIMLGDTDQLPSVGAGAILRDMIDSEVIPVAKLVKTFRQGNESGIFLNMKKIRVGEGPLVPMDDFEIYRPDKKWSAEQLLLGLYKREFNRLGGAEQVCLLTPFRNEQFHSSSEYLNKKIQAIVNPCGDEIRTTSNGIFRVNDQVMQLENREEVANGDVGKVIAIKDGIVTVEYCDCKINYERDALENKEIVLAYAMSVHKSQGSEYKSVITCLLNENGPMLQRNLLYTAVTRAKKNLYLVCEDQAVETALANEASCKRVTLLVEKLKATSLNKGLIAA